MDLLYESGGCGIVVVKIDMIDFFVLFNGFEVVLEDIRNLLLVDCCWVFDGVVSKNKEWESCWGME